ncbi:adenylate/guanylate cyclase domain-containing protein [bacterium]|jgi:adenylate cyclase|nr:adenylate/guanylate cyclase domain-containing protein [bacterium]
MKNRIWLFQIPVILLFACGLFVTQQGAKGSLENKFLREKTYKSLQVLSGWFTNVKFKTRGPVPPKNKIVIVEIDSDALEQVGRWPWHRDATALLIERIFAAGAKAVALDIVFSEEDRRVSEEVAAVLKQKGMGDKIASLETDPILRDTIQHHQNQLVTGWFTEVDCQPLFWGDDCPVNHPEYIQRIQPEFKKFAFQRAIFPANFDRTKTPLISVPLPIVNLPMFNEVSKHSGFVQAWADEDGYIRRTNLLMLVDGKPYPALALEMARVALDEELEIQLDDKQKVERLAFGKSGRAIPVSPLGAMEINFRGPSYTSFQYLRALEVMQPEDQMQIEVNRTIASASKSELLKDALVFVGLTAKGAYDMRAFPFDSLSPGVEGHANILDNLLSNDMLTQGSRSSSATFWLLFLMTVGAGLFAFYAQRLESVPGLALFISVMAVVSIVDFNILFNRNNMNWNTGLLYIELITIFVSTLAVKYVLEEKNKKFIRGAFSKYVAPAIVDSILKDPSKLSVGGEKKDLSILFSDIRNFTSFSEVMDAKLLAQFLNDYLGIMTDIVFECSGTLDKYIGDAVMSFWGAPLGQVNHGENACKAAIKMMEALKKNQARFKSQYGVDVNIGIGINSGPVNVGNMGSSRIFEYTVIGDHVNLASRLEGLTKTYGADILTSRFTLDGIQKAGGQLPPHRTLDLVKVKGKQNAVELIQVFAEEWPQEAIKTFESAIGLYRSQNWDLAIQSFKEASRIKEAKLGQPDHTSLMYIERCEEFKKLPPQAGWDGSWEMHSK